MLLYGAATAPTTLACLSTILATPSAPNDAGPKDILKSLDAEHIADPIALTSSQRIQLLASFVPFFVVPLFMALDMGARLVGLAVKGLKVEEETGKKGKKN